jgi:hypothetical protein
MAATMASTLVTSPDNSDAAAAPASAAVLLVNGGGGRGGAALQSGSCGSGVLLAGGGGRLATFWHIDVEAASGDALDELAKRGDAVGKIDLLPVVGERRRTALAHVDAQSPAAATRRANVGARLEHHLSLLREPRDVWRDDEADAPVLLALGQLVVIAARELI